MQTDLTQGESQSNTEWKEVKKRELQNILSALSGVFCMDVLEKDQILAQLFTGTLSSFFKVIW